MPGFNRGSCSYRNSRDFVNDSESPPSTNPQEERIFTDETFNITGTQIPMNYQ